MSRTRTGWSCPDMPLKQFDCPYCEQPTHFTEELDDDDQEILSCGCNTDCSTEKTMEKVRQRQEKKALAEVAKKAAKKKRAAPIAVATPSAEPASPQLRTPSPAPSVAPIEHRDGYRMSGYMQ